ncbi:MAG TPA: 50S ribosomal protein L29 [Candidatus Hydrogenedentes bacterium]|nr:50S ribosomal protein L29 [Candidatus Hydrogenedentota bacterium]
MKANQLREMTGEQLQERLDKRQRDLLAHRIQATTEIVENVRVVREARREIARIKTVLRERELAAAKRSQ